MEKLIRFDWAIKKLLRNKANFDILEGFLSAMFQEDVTMVNILESEGNQEDETDKFNRVDLVVENAKHELILIEVQVQAEHDFFQRISYGVSKLITEYIEQGQPYKDVKKVVSVSVTYFNLGIGDDYLYYGSTQFVGRHTHDTLQLTDKLYEAFGTRDVHKLFPEHYLIRVEKFPDTVHEAIDEWIYMLKHSEVKPEFTSKHIQEASAKLRLMNLNEAQRRAYDNYMQNVSYKQSMLWSSREEGREEGQQKATRNIARKLLANHIALDIIATSTGLSVEQIRQLQDEKA
jgi:predicted transposase/invertase (TIGR01784 family)